ncbi:hypothetical protein GTA08_BOTSDO00667 [Botryosphaeria dothidea]|uniref:Reverse transcriptase Ty1/copia-type domain-containing protein n=1 Tax=Botryosphaeria dothidea TaxID=55169 RepID=A0A8H4N6F8_9PEZI|nr:hypothetical protein GTA08_BOTSDO00667 [Botryosphaeria dothidea]
MEATHKEFRQHIRNGTWRKIKRPNGNIRILPVKWIWKYKEDADGYLALFKARLVVRGDKQRPGLDYFATYAAVARASTLRLIFALVAVYDLEYEQVDIVSAFIQSLMDQKGVYIRLPEGFREYEGNEELIKITTFLKSKGYEPLFSDLCVFYHKEHKGVIIVYVDDILLIHKRKDVILNMHNALAKRYELRNLGPDTYIEEIVHKYGMSNSKHTNTPMVPDGANLQPFKSTASPNITSEYQSLIGSIGYAANMTRADIAYATHKLCQFTHNPSEEHLSHAKRVLAYLNTYPNLAICLRGVEEGVLGLQLHHKGVYGPPGLQLHGAANAAFADNADNRSSTFGYAFKAAGGLISYKSSRQGLVTTSSTEAESCNTTILTFTHYD